MKHIHFTIRENNKKAEWIMIFLNDAVKKSVKAEMIH